LVFVGMAAFILVTLSKQEIDTDDTPLETSDTPPTHAPKPKKKPAKPPADKSPESPDTPDDTDTPDMPTHAPKPTAVIPPKVLAQEAQTAFCEEYQKADHPKLIEASYVLPKLQPFVSAENPTFSGVAGMYVFSKEADIVSKSIASTGIWEHQETNNMLSVLARGKASGRKNPVFLDIGSNIGWFSVVMRGFGYRVLAVDAMENNGILYRSTLCKNPELMKNTTFFNKGLGTKSQKCIIISGVINFGDGQLMCSPEGSDEYPKLENPWIGGYEYVIRQQIEIVLLDDLIATIDCEKHPEADECNIWLLKIDVEGFEYNVLSGAKKLFTKQKIPYIMSEVSRGMMGPENYVKYYLLLKEFGYQVSLSSFDGPYIELPDTVEQFKDPRPSVDYPYNIFCSRAI